MCHLVYLLTQVQSVYSPCNFLNYDVMQAISILVRAQQLCMSHAQQLVTQLNISNKH